MNGSTTAQALHRAPLRTQCCLLQVVSALAVQLLRPGCACLAALIAVLGCAGVPPAAPPAPTVVQRQAPPSHVERGELFVSGAEVYDEYFALVHELHAYHAALQIEERSVLAPLAGLIGLLPTATRSHIIERMASGACPPENLAQRGDSDGAGGGSGTVCRTTLSRKDRRLVVMLGSTIQRESNLVARMKGLAQRAQRLRELGRTLSGTVATDLAVQSEQRRNRARTELARSVVVLESIRDEATRECNTIRAFMRDVSARLVLVEREGPVGPSDSMRRVSWKLATRRPGR